MSLCLHTDLYRISPWVLTAWAALREKNLEFTLKDLDLDRGDQRQDDYLGRSLFGKVPVLDHDGYWLSESLAIADIAGACGLSVGSFYGRFRDKETFFAVLQQQITDEWVRDARQALQAPARGQPDAARLFQHLCALIIGRFRQDAGFIRAAIKHASTHPDSWTPIKRAGRQIVDELVLALSPLMPQRRAAERAERIRTAMQMLFGTAINAVLHDPGPLRLADPRLERELARALLQYLGLPDRARTRARRAAPPDVRPSSPPPKKAPP